MLWLGMRGRAGDEALVTLLECLPCGHWVGVGHGRHCAQASLTIDAGELLAWYEREQRDLPWRRPEVTPWQILVSEFMLQQTPVARVEPIWLRLDRALAHAVGDRGRRRRRRAAGLGQARLPASRQAAARVRDGDRHRARRRGARRRRDAADAAGSRRLHRAGRRLLRLRQPRARRRHQRPPGGRQGGARPRRLPVAASAISTTSPPCCPMTLTRRGSRSR